MPLDAECDPCTHATFAMFKEVWLTGFVPCACSAQQVGKVSPDGLCQTVRPWDGTTLPRLTGESRHLLLSAVSQRNLHRLHVTIDESMRIYAERPRINVKRGH